MKPGSTVVVVGDGAVGLLGVLSAKKMGGERIIAMSGHGRRQKERGEEGAAHVRDLTKGLGADSGHFLPERDRAMDERRAIKTLLQP